MIPASMASMAASLANRGGTKLMAALGDTSLTASATELNTGTPSTAVPAFPGVTPATTAVP